MELWDIYNKYRHKTNRTHDRSNPMREGDYHIVVHVWIVNDDGEFLIQKRQPWKKGWANMWDCAAAGSALLGESSEEAAIREAKEEIGLDLDMDKSEFLFTIKFHRGFDDVWLIRQNADIKELKLQYEEVADVKWVSYEEMKQMAFEGEFIQYSYFDRLYELLNSGLVLKKATIDEAETLLDLQREIFMPLYEKYQDYDTSPVTQSKERFLRRFDIGDYYKILFQNTLVGSVYVYEKALGIMKFHIINIFQEYEGKGICQEVMKRLESMYPQAESWELETIQSEKRNCYIYEKMGYVQSQEKKVINDNMTIITYIKRDNLYNIKEIFI